MAIDFPNSPSSGDIHTVSGKQWQWDGEKWLAYGSSLAPDVLKVDSGNNRVGINQTTPTVALDVTGSARITGDLTVSGTTVTVDSASVLVKDRVQFEGATANAYETILVATDPTADRTITLPDATGPVALTGGASTAITVADTTDTTCFVGLFESATGDLGPKSDAGITYNAGTGTLTATAFAGPLTGNVTSAAQTAITSVGTLTGLTVASSGKFLHYTNFRSFTGTNTDTGLGDAGEIILMNNGSANTYNITDNSTCAHPVGTSIMVFQQGAGQTTINPTGSTVIRSKDSNRKLTGQYSSAVATKIATDEWILVGDLAA